MLMIPREEGSEKELKMLGKKIENKISTGSQPNVVTWEEIFSLMTFLPH